MPSLQVLLTHPTNVLYLHFFLTRRSQPSTGLNPPSLAPMLALGSALGCVGGISCLSSQKTARLGVYVGMSGILTGLAATLAYMNPAEMGTYAQVTITTIPC